MKQTIFSSLFAVVAGLLALSSSVADAHIMMTNPPPRRARNNPGLGNAIDYDGTSPLADSSEFPCKRFPAQSPVLTAAAGSTVPVTLSGGANHDGGHCQFALSYDGDKTFVVIETIIRQCLRSGTTMNVDLPIPASAPAGRATLAWTWINAVGNREYYMSCADIVVTNSQSDTLLSGPELLIANLDGSQYQFPEFAGNNPDHREYFTERPIVTVSGNGIITTATATSTTESNSQTTPTTTQSTDPTNVEDVVTVTVTVTSTIYAEEPETSTLAPTTTPTDTTLTTSPTSTPSTGVCTDGEYRCGSDNQTWAVCDHGSWVENRPVPAGTKCTQVGSAIIFENA